MADSGRLRVGIFIDTYFPMIDGVVMCVDNYARYLSQFADVTVFTTQVSREYEDEEPYRVVRCRSLPLPGEDYVVPTPELDPVFVEKLMLSKLDIVHLNSPFTVGHAGLRYARLMDVPVVATMHSQFRTDFRRALKLNKLADAALERIMTVFESADEVWVPNAGMAEVYADYGGTKTPCVRSNATDMKPVPDRAAARARVNEKYGLRDDETVLLFVGRLILQKNILFIAEAAKELKERTKKPFRVLYVGSGQDEQELRQRIEELGLGDVALLTGRVTDRTELAELYARASLFLFPSLYDANSLVQIEAASQGTPTLFLKGAVTGATATDGVDGYFSENDPKQYAEAVLRIMDDPAAHERVCAAALQNVYKSWDDVISQMLSDYRRLIAAHVPARPERLLKRISDELL